MRSFRPLGIVAVLIMLSTLSAGAQNAQAWRVGAVYARGSRVSYDGAVYKCVYAHTAVGGWEPAKVPALWRAVKPPVDSSPQRHTVPPKTRRMFAPYVHMTETNNDLPALHAASGIKFFTLAFLVSDGKCSPAWQGKTLLPLANENSFSPSIQRLRAAGSDVIISFGGYLGQELAQACPDVASLQAAYQAVVDKYQAKLLDFDVEASAVNDPPSIDRRNQALKALAAANPGLQISFTLPAFPAGMPEPALNVLSSAVRIETPVAVVNIMAMDYGYPVPEGNMGPAAIAAADSAWRQLQSLQLRAALGITPMIGMNDSAGETFTPADARTLMSYARKNPDIALLSMWAVGRDNATCTGVVSPTCSGIAQQPWEFSRIFRSFR